MKTYIVKVWIKYYNISEHRNIIEKEEHEIEAKTSLGAAERRFYGENWGDIEPTFHVQEKGKTKIEKFKFKKVIKVIRTLKNP